MLLHLDARALKDWLTACPDAEELGNDEYTVDLYDAETPLSLDLQLGKQGVELLAALTLRYDEELDGWYLDQRVEDAALVERMLQSALEAGARPE